MAGKFTFYQLQHRVLEPLSSAFNWIPVKMTSQTLFSPINHIGEINAPALLIHGQYDKVASKEQPKRMAKRMKRAKKNVTYIELPKGDHYLSSGKNRMTAMEAIAKFVVEHI